MKHAENTRRFAAIFAGGTMISRISGLGRDVVVNVLIPQPSQNSFWFAFQLPNMLRDMLGEGAANAAFIPVLAESKARDNESNYRRLVSSALSAMVIVFAALTLLGIAAMPYLRTAMAWVSGITGAAVQAESYLQSTVAMMQWTFPYLLLIGLAVFATAPLFNAGRYATASWSPALLNVAFIVCCWLFYRHFDDPAWSLVIGVWVGGVLQLVVMWAAMKKHVGVLWPNFRLRDPRIARIFWLLGPVILGQTMGEINKLVDSFFAYSLHQVPVLFYANRLVQLPLSIFGLAVAAAILPTMAAAHSRGEQRLLRETVAGGFLQSAFLVLPSMVGLIVLAQPVVRLLFQWGEFDPVTSEQTATATALYGLGLLAFAWIRVAAQAFYAAQDTKTPVIVASCAMLLNIILKFVLVDALEYRGLALATTIAFTGNFLVLFTLLHLRLGRLFFVGDLWELLKIAAAAALMGTAAYSVSAAVQYGMGNSGFLPRALAVTLPVATAILLYIALCRVFRVKEMAHLVRSAKRRSPA